MELRPRPIDHLHVPRLKEILSFSPQVQFFNGPFVSLGRPTCRSLQLAKKGWSGGIDDHRYMA